MKSCRIFTDHLGRTCVRPNEFEKERTAAVVWYNHGDVHLIVECFCGDRHSEKSMTLDRWDLLNGGLLPPACEHIGVLLERIGFAQFFEGIVPLSEDDEKFRADEATAFDRLIEHIESFLPLET